MVMMKYVIILLLFGQLRASGDVSLAPTNAHLQFAHAALYSLTNELTITAWVTPELLRSGGTDGNVVIAKDDGGSQRSFYLQYYVTNLLFMVRVGAASKSLYSGETWRQNTNHFIAATRSASGVQTIYIDGIYKNSVTNSGAMDASTAPITIGCFGNYVYDFKGKMSDVRLFSRALTAREIGMMYEQPWSLAEDTYMAIRTGIATSDTGAVLSGTALNYGTGADGAYSNSPVAAPGKVSLEPPLEDIVP